MRYLIALLAGFATACTAVHAASEIEIPSLRVGLWESKMVSDGKEDVSRRCVDASKNKLTVWFGKKMGEGAEHEICWRVSAQKVGNAYEVESFCKHGNTLYTVISGDFEQAYTVEMRSIVDVPGKGQVAVIRVEERWIGPCPDNQSGGANAPR
jgi:hypothetical protein